MRKRRDRSMSRLFSSGPLDPATLLIFCLATRSRSSTLRLSVGLGYADIAADLVFANFIDHQLLREVRTGCVEENWLVKRTIRLDIALVFDGHKHAILVALLVHTLEFQGNVSALLRFVLAVNGEFEVIAFTQAPKLVDFIVIACDKRAHFTTGHF